VVGVGRRVRRKRSWREEEEETIPKLIVAERRTRLLE